MHGHNRTFAVSLSAFLLMGCASSPPQQPARKSDSTASSIHLSAHEMFFADMVAVIAAMGGNNPNPGYHAMTIKGCGPNARFLTGPQALDTRSSQTLQTATVSAPCPRIAALK